ncbi:hypothetical protein IMSAGC016_01675 [Muribaculaceae bacterium]|nr:hypothetical protein IMSAGC016_01675 [Muribaculaceae bacterium]
MITGDAVDIGTLRVINVFERIIVDTRCLHQFSKIIQIVYKHISLGKNAQILADREQPLDFTIFVKFVIFRNNSTCDTLLTLFLGNISRDCRQTPYLHK